MLQYLLVSAALLFSIIIFLVVFIFAMECLAGCLRQPLVAKQLSRRPTLAVVIPAHNEELQITQTVHCIRSQMWLSDRVLVIADNCNDLTAQNALEAGAEVVERNDPVLRGKGYALDAGIQHLSKMPPEVVIIIDADCWLEPEALSELAQMAAATNRPVQARYLMVGDPAAPLNLAISEFAFLLKNRVRFLGLNRLGLAVQLTGSGMAFPWPVLHDVRLANANLVEDMKLGLDLARAGHAPLFCDSAVVKSRFPYTAKGLETQAARWNGGRFHLMASSFSALCRTDTLQNKFYLAMLIDALVPPVTLLAALVFAALVATGLLAASGSTILPLLLSTASALIVAVALAAAWWRHGREVLTRRMLLGIPRYTLNRIRRYPGQIIGARTSSWIRTDRHRPTDK